MEISDYILCENWKERKNATSGKIFKILPDFFPVAMDWKVNTKIFPQKINGLKMTQFPVSSNIVATGHTLQGQPTKNI